MTGSFKCARRSDGKKAAIVSILVLAALMVGLVLSVAACGGGGGLEGTWTSDTEGDTVTITADKITVVSPDGTLEFNYKTDGDQLILTMEGFDQELPATYKLEGDTLTLNADGEEVVYKRK